MCGALTQRPPRPADQGAAKAYHKVASLIVAGDMAFVIVPYGPGEFQYTDTVRVKPGQQEYLEILGDGAATTALVELPGYQ